MDLHEIYLQEMMKRLTEVDEDPSKLEATILEIGLYQVGTFRQLKACDYIGVYKNYYNLIDLKAQSKPHHAYQQMLSTQKWMAKLTDKPLRDMKMVIYGRGGYDVHYISHNGNYIGRK